jgi:hypothetical protein
MKNIFLHLTFWSANYANLFNNRLTDEGSACFWPLKPKTRARRAHIGFVCGGPRWSFWRPPLLSEPGVSFVHRSMRSSGLLFLMLRQKKTVVVGHRILGFLYGAAVWYSTLVALRRLLHIGEGYLGGIGNTAPSSSDSIPMGSKRFALQGIEYAFLLLSSYFDVY